MTQYLDAVFEYCERVESGQRLAGKLEQQAVARFRRDLARADDWPYYFNEKLAHYACDFFRTFLQHTDGQYAGQPFDCLPFQDFCTANLWGFRRKSDDRRRFQEGFYSLGRGNGKTPYGAGLCLLALGFDVPIEQRAEVYSIAVKRDQARIAFEAAKRYVSESKSLRNYFDIKRDKISLLSRYSTFEPLSSDAKSLDGRNIHFVLRDEVHAWTNYYRPIYDKIETALAKRVQPLAVTTTTAGDETSDIWWENYCYAAKVLDPKSGVDEETLFVYICEIDDDDDELDEAVWPKANPMLEYGVVKIEGLRKLARKASVNSGERSTFRRYYGNKLSFSANKIITPEAWSKGNAAVPDGVTMHTPHAAIDLGWVDDFASIGYCYPLDLVTVEIVDEETGSVETTLKRRYFVDADIFIPKGTPRNLDRNPFRDWIAAKLVNVSNSEATDTATIYKALFARQKRDGIKTLAFDPNNAREFALNCANNGIETFPFQQSTKKYHEPLREFLIALNEGRIFHNNNLVLGWFAQNCVTRTDAAGLSMPDKALSLEKIDAFVGVLMAYSEALFAERDLRSVYETRGPILF